MKRERDKKYQYDIPESIRLNGAAAARMSNTTNEFFVDTIAPSSNVMCGGSAEKKKAEENDEQDDDEVIKKEDTAGVPVVAIKKEGARESKYEETPTTTSAVIPVHVGSGASNCDNDWIAGNWCWLLPGEAGRTTRTTTDRDNTKEGTKEGNYEETTATATVIPVHACSSAAACNKDDDPITNADKNNNRSSSSSCAINTANSNNDNDWIAGTWCWLSISPGDDDSTDIDNIGDDNHAALQRKRKATATAGGDDDEEDSMVIAGNTNDDTYHHGASMDDGATTTNHIESNISTANNESLSLPSAAGAAGAGVKDEICRQKIASERKGLYRKYGDRFLLHRHHKMGIARLGGYTQSTFAYPAAKNPVLKDPNYPKPKSVIDAGGAYTYNGDDYTYLACDTSWQPNGPMYAGQKTAALSVCNYSEQPFPLFMKRTRTGAHNKAQGALLGWEYVGNYKGVPEQDALPFWESAKNLTEGSKNQIAKKVLQSSGYGRKSLTCWRNHLMDAIQEDKNVSVEPQQPPTDPPPPPTLSQRALALGFRPEMSDTDLAAVMVRLDEFHGQSVIEFVSYDERIYNYCSGGKTSRTKKGGMIQNNGSDTPATANDWYDFAEQNMIFKY